ncbi:MAG: class I SAM-dependent methyltransferase [Acidobacteria bacterium]|nr:class I SAM-dependent methyltransferase [Acidobacteriota bacterium]
MSEKKSDKELAFLRDLYVSTDWGERFAELLDDNLKLPQKGRILYVEAGTGGHAMAVLERAEDDVRMVCVDESEECLELARAKAVAMNVEPEFRRERLDALSLRDNQFEMTIGDGSLVAPERLSKMLSELVRVTAPGGTVAFTLTTAGSFGEFFSIYWEALQSAGLEDHGVDVEELITELPTVAQAEELAAAAGLEVDASTTRVEEFDYDSGEEFLNSPLVTDFLLRAWMQSLPEAAQTRVLTEIARIIDEDRKEMDFALSVKATLVTGRKK